MERDDVESESELMEEVERRVPSLAEPTIEQLYLADDSAHQNPPAQPQSLLRSILQEWCASMDLQPIHRANAAAKYSLGNVLKSDTDNKAEQELERYVPHRQEQGAEARDVYRAVHQLMKARVTSPSEACFLMEGLPVVLATEQQRGEDARC
eukprot:6131746-Amphidinium_carterae.1